MIYIVMGVSGAGKTLIGQKLADKLNVPFYDADDFHPPENVEKMERGQPLNDRDRLPWLQKLKLNMNQWQQNGGAVLACSALKKSYRAILSSPELPIRFIFLKGPKKLVAERMSKRTDHFMPEKLLNSQFEALEEPADAIIADIRQTPQAIIQSILNQIEEKKL